MRGIVAKSTFLKNSDVLMAVALFKSEFVTKLDKSDSTFCFYYWYIVLQNNSFCITISFLSTNY